MVLLTDAGPDLVLLYRFCCLESGVGGVSLLHKEKGCKQSPSCALFLTAASLDPYPELHIILGEIKLKC